MTQEELKAKAKSFGLSTGEFVALRHIHSHFGGTDKNVDEFVGEVVKLLRAIPGEA